MLCSHPVLKPNYFVKFYVTESETFIIFKKIMLGDLIYMSPYNLVRKKTQNIVSLNIAFIFHISFTIIS